MKVHTSSTMAFETLDTPPNNPAQTANSRTPAILIPLPLITLLTRVSTRRISPAHRFLAKLLPSGLPDPSFDLGSHFDGPVYGLGPQESGDWLIYGSFQSVKGVRRTGLARVSWDDVQIRAEFSSASNPRPLLFLKTQKGRTVQIEHSIDLKTWTPRLTITMSVSEWSALLDRIDRGFYRAVLLPSPQ